MALRVPEGAANSNAVEAQVSYGTRLVYPALLVLCVVIGAGSLAIEARAQKVKVNPFLCDTGGCPPNPASVSIVPGNMTDTAVMHTETITMCASPFVTDTATFNGAMITGFTRSNNCDSKGASYALVPGANVFYAVACSNSSPGHSGQCVSGSVLVTHPPLVMGPKAAADTLSPRTTATQKFAIRNTSTTQETYALTWSCTGPGVASCSAPTSVVVPGKATDTVTVTENVTDTVSASGVIQLKATNNGFADSGWFNYTVRGHMTVSTAYTNQEDQDYTRCAASCFAATAAMKTVPYVSRGTARGVTLVYNGDRVALRPTVYADVTMAQPVTDTVQTFQLRAYVLGTLATFTNGDQVLNFAGSPANHAAKPFRLAGVINVDQTLLAASSGVYQMTLVVTANFADHTEQIIDTTHALSIFNTRGSHVARGWTVAGVPITYSYIHNGGHIDQLKELFEDGAGSSVTYTTTNGCQPVCVPVLPAGVFSTLIPQFDHVGNFQGMQRFYPDSSKEFYGPESPIGTSAYRISRTLADTVAFTYDTGTGAPDTGASPRVLTISDPQRMYNGKHAVITLHYDATNGYLSRIVEPGADGAPDSGRVTTVKVTATGLLTTWIDPDGDTTHFGYDSHGRLDTLVDRNGHATTYSYDSVASKLITVSSPRVPIDTNPFSPLDTIPLVTVYRPWQLVGVPDSSTARTPWTPVEADTVEAMVTTTAGDTSHFTVDQWGEPLVAIGNDTIRTIYGRDINGFAISVTRPIGAHDTASYSGPFLMMNQPAGQDPTHYAYGAFGQMTSISGPNIPTRIFHLGSRGHVDSTTVNGSTTQFHADALLRDTSTVDAMGDTTRYHYDSFTGNVDTVSSLARSSTATSYRYTSKRFDRYGRDSVVRTSGTGSPTIVTTVLYDLLNRPDSVFDGVHSLPTIYHRDGLNVTQITDPKGQVYTTTYNSLNLPITKTDPMNRTASTTYTAHLVPARVTNQRGQKTLYTYDALVRLTHVERPANMPGELDTLEIINTSRLGDTVNTWNPVMHESFYLSKATGYLDSALTFFRPAGNRSFKRNYFYDSRGRLDSVAITPSSNVTGIDPYTRAYHYDPNTAVLNSVAIGPASISFKYDALFRPDTVTYSSSPVMRNDVYTSIGTVSTTTWNGLNLYRGYGYDSAGRVIEVDHGMKGLPTPDSVEFYSYNPLGELTQHVVGKWSDSLTTCPNNQLIGNGCSVSEKRTYTTLVQGNFVWDSAGNLDSTKVGSADTTGTFSPGNRLASWGGMTFTSDSDGNRKSSSAGPQYTWSSDGRLLSITSGSTTRVYDYDNFGQLARRTTNGSVDRYYLWDAGQLLAILDDSANARIAEFAYNPGSVDVPLVRITGPKGSSSVHFYARDVLHNVIGQFSGSTLEQSLGYDPGGVARISTTTGDTTQLRWKGLLYEDGVTSLYYVRARWYDPATRRFISPDRLGLSAGINQFAFAGGDPVNGSDPTGLMCDDTPDDCGGGGGGGGADGGNGDGSTDGGSPSSAAPSAPDSTCRLGNATAQGTCGNSQTAPDLQWYMQQAENNVQVSQSLCGNTGPFENCQTFTQNGVVSTSNLICCQIVGGANITNITVGFPSSWSFGVSGAGFTAGVYANGIYFGNGGGLGTLLGGTTPIPTSPNLCGRLYPHIGLPIVQNCP